MLLQISLNFLFTFCVFVIGYLFIILPFKKLIKYILSKKKLNIIEIVERYNYYVDWSKDDNEFVGLCIEFPSLSYLAKNKNEALNGIKNLVHIVIKDLKKNKESLPEIKLL